MMEHLHIVSKERSTLMGVAIIMIMLFHCAYYSEIPALTAIVRNWDMGVDMFALMSGLGIFFSLSKDGNSWGFYKKRLARIVPAFLIVVIPYSIYRYFGGLSFKYLLTVVTMLSGFRGDTSFWFISYIMACYAISPLLFKLQKRTKRVFLLTAASIVVSTLFYYFVGYKINNSDLWILRFPVFVLGMEIGNIVKNGEYTAVQALSTKEKCLMILAAIAGIAVVSCSRLLNEGTRLSLISQSLMYLAGTPLLLVPAGYLFQRLNKAGNVFAYFGAISLELYLVHERICLRTVGSFCTEVWLYVIVSIAMAVVLAKLVSLLSGKIAKLILK